MRLLLLLLLSGSAYAADDKTRGELLYTMHCSACHSVEIHWRDRRRVKDWGALLDEVERWQAMGNLQWGVDEIFDVAHYLNSLHYGFPEPGHKGYTQRENHLRTK